MEKNENKTKFGEKVSLTIRKRWLINGSKTFLIVAILIAAYIAINLFVKSLDLPEFDVTANKLYTLSDASKKVIEKVDQDVTIYVYGFEEKSSLIDFIKQYNQTNDKIKYEILTEETNYQMIQDYDLQEGYYVIIFKSGDSEKVIDAAYDLSSYNYVTGQTVDITEQTITNSILALTEENKPKIYFVEGHNEYTMSNMMNFTTLLKNEAFEMDTLNIATKGVIPEDCNILAIMSPASDFLETEVQAIKDYINKGGNIYFAMDVISQDLSLPNLQSVLDEYGVSVKNGCIFEYAEDQAVANSPYVFMPEVSSSHEITSDIYTDSKQRVWLAFSAKLEFKDENALKNLGVEKETLISSSEQSAFITDLSNMSSSSIAETAEIGSAEIGSALTKTITKTNEDGTTSNVTSKLIVLASASFMSDQKISALSTSYPLSYLGCNSDFAINSMSYLGEKDNSLTIRKDMSTATYAPTSLENRVVVTIIFIVPILIIFTGVVVWNYRRKRK